MEINNIIFLQQLSWHAAAKGNKTDTKATKSIKKETLNGKKEKEHETYKLYSALNYALEALNKWKVAYF